MVKKNAEYKGIQKKLVAAIAMVLVASIMVVTSSYAWFTLSTAPEVTGINTAVGSNGNLEIALRETELGTNIGNSEGLQFPAANNYWGNLVDLSDASYHLGDIALQPAAILANENTPAKTVYATDSDGFFVNASGTKIDFDGVAGDPVVNKKQEDLQDGDMAILAAQGKVESNIPATYEFTNITGNAYIQVPEYGADGRVSGMNQTSFTSVYDTSANGFLASETVNKYGVRAVGTSSSLDPAELAMMNARKAVSGAKGTALRGAKNSLSDDATKLANIVLKNELQPGSSYAEDIPNVKAAITNLLNVTDALEDAIRSSVVALGLSQGKTVDKTALTFTKTTDGETTTYTIGGTDVEWTKAEGNDPATDPGFDYSKYKTMLVEAYEDVVAMRAELNSALTDANSLTDTAEYDDIMAVVASMFSADDIRINGAKIDSNNLYGLGMDMLSGDAVVTIVKGIYCDIAKFVGDYQTPATMHVEGTFQIIGEVKKDVTVTMSITNPGATTPDGTGIYLDCAYAWLNTLKAVSGGATGGTTLMNDLYAYIVDLAFRTNAANSNLLLQTEATDRVYQDAAEGSATQGGGSYMEFTSPNADFTIKQMIGLMENIRVVFFTPDGQIAGVAGLDVEMAPKKDAQGNTLYYEVDGDGQPTEVETTTPTAFKVYEQAKDANDQPIYENALGQWTTEDAGNTPVMGTPSFEITDVANRTVKAKLYLHAYEINNTQVTLKEKLESQVLAALDQNQVKALSALVYLDGNEVTNADVAIGGNSMTGKLNLQFASDATLDPMDYTFGEQLKQPTVANDGSNLTITTNAEDNNKTKQFKIAVQGTDISETLVLSENATSATFELSKLSTLPAGEYTIQIVASATGYLDSNVVTVEYTVAGTAQTPPETTEPTQALSDG